jgi:predicted ATPase
VGFTRYVRGEFAEAREQGERALELFDLEQERALVRAFQLPSSVVCLSFLTQSLLLMGYPDQARRRHQELLDLVEALANPACTIVGYGVGMYYELDLRDHETIARNAEQGYRLSDEAGYVFWAAAMQVYRGWARSLVGDAAAGVAEMRAGLDAFVRTGAGLSLSGMMLMLAEALREDGQPEAALDALASAMRIAGERNERYYEADLHRMRGELLLERGEVEAGEASLRRAIEVARRQQARLLELRSALVLARLLLARGARDEARLLLRPLYGGFTEGHGARELVEARELLHELAPAPA